MNKYLVILLLCFTNVSAGGLSFPFSRANSWEICQGYNTSNISHNGNLKYSLDFGFGTGHSGSTGCYKKPNATKNKEVRAPASGIILWNGSSDTDITCLQLDNPVSTGDSNIKSLGLGHLQSGENRLAADTSVDKGDVIGIACGAGECPSDGGYAHIHISAHTDNKCGKSEITPFGKSFDGFDFYSDGSERQWHGFVVRALTNISPFISTLLLDKTKPTHPLNDTGITRCGDFAHGSSGIHSKDLDCNLSTDSEGDPIPPGQDALFGLDKTHNSNLDGNAGFSFTKIDNNGDALSPTASNWSCIEDNVTNLMWEIKTTNGGLRDKDWVYTWYNNNSTANGGNPGVENGGNCIDSVSCDTEKYVAKINVSNLCGHNDWRVPEREELRSIIDYGSQLTGARIDSSWFPNLGNSGDYWTNSTFSLLSDSAWLFRIEAGSDLYFKKNFARRVVLTRGGKNVQASPVTAIGNNQTCNSSITASTPLERFVIHENGTVTDKRTGLMWKKCREGKNGLMCEEGNEIIPGWKSALDHADVHTFAGYSDWRLPNIKEIASLTEFSCSFPGLNRNVFPNISSGTTWSSSQCFASENCAHTFSFDVGADNTNGKTSTRAVHLVRDPT